MTAKRILVLAALVTLTLVTPVAAEVVRYPTATDRAGDIEVTVDAHDSVTAMTMPTAAGRVVMTAAESSSWVDYQLTLAGTGETIAMTLIDGGDGTWGVTVDFGFAGSVSYTRQTDGTLTLGPSSITDCSAITDSDLHAALQAGWAAAAVAGTDHTAGMRKKSHLQYVANVLRIVSDSVHVQQTVECESVQPDIFWNVCFWYPTYDECADCCLAAEAAAAAAMTLPCAGAGPLGAGGCLVALAASAYACRTLCHVTIPDPADGEEGETCGSMFSWGNCFQLCPAGTYDGGEMGCEPPLTCCLINQ